MNSAIIDLVASTYFRREGTLNPSERVIRFMRDYGCSEEHSIEIMKIMDMLSHGCFQIAERAAYAGTSGEDEMEHFFEATFPGLSTETKAEIARYAKSII